MQRTILLPSNTKTAASSPPHKQIFIWFRGAVTGLKSKPFARVLSRYTDTSHPTFGFFHTGRSASFKYTARVPGPCVNLLPLSIPSEGKSDVDIALQIQNELSKRVPFEQSYLRDIICWKEGLDPQSSDSYPQPLFNASLNLLWSSKHQTGKIDERDKLMEPMDIGVRTNFISEEAILGRTAVDGLKTGYLAKQNLFMDVGPVEESDTVDFGVKCDYALIDEEELREFVAAIAREIESIVGGLTVG